MTANFTSAGLVTGFTLNALEARRYFEGVALASSEGGAPGSSREELGEWVETHYRALAERDGYGKVAARLKKQAWPLRIALRALLGVAERDT